MTINMLPESSVFMITCTIGPKDTDNVGAKESAGHRDLAKRSEGTDPYISYAPDWRSRGRHESLTDCFFMDLLYDVHMFTHLHLKKHTSVMNYNLPAIWQKRLGSRFHLTTQT